MYIYIPKRVLIALTIALVTGSLVITVAFWSPRPRDAAMAIEVPTIDPTVSNSIPMSVFNPPTTTGTTTSIVLPSTSVKIPDNSAQKPTPQPRTQPPVNNSPGATSKIEIVISFALAQVGKRYVWGAAGPNAYDCSGLVMTAFLQIGIRLPHHANDMVTFGKRVPNRASLQRGDIILPQSGHVGIYLGNGKYVNASTPQRGIRIDDVYGFYSARRLI